MSLTEEQLNNLKPGDPIIIHSTFERMASGGEIVGYTDTVDGRGKIVADYRHIHRSCVSLPPTKPKYDPCRKFKKGDIVRLKDWNGRRPAMYSGTNSWFDHPQRCKNGNLEVRGDEKSSKVEIGIIGVDCAHAYAAPCYLELITPIEELKPYSVLETDTINGFDIMRDGLCVMTFPYGSKEAGYYRNKLAAKEAAEAEADRLNAEYRKEHNNEHT